MLKIFFLHYRKLIYDYQKKFLNCTLISSMLTFNNSSKTFTSKAIVTPLQLTQI